MTPSDDNAIEAFPPAGEAASEPPEVTAGTPAALVPDAAQAAPVNGSVELRDGETPVSGTPPSPHPSLQNGETLIQSGLSILVIVLFVITFIVQAFQIPSESMEKTLLIGDYLLVDKVHFGQGRLSSRFLPYVPLQRGDVIVFHYPVDPSQHFVKRVVAIPGDRIHLRNKTVFLNDVPIEEQYAIHVPGDHDPYRDNFPSASDTSGQVNPPWNSELLRHLYNGDLVVPPDEYFVMGDNRDHSLDSRYWGFVPRANIVGRPLVIYLSVRSGPDRTDSGNDKLISSGRLLTHIWQFARWGRMFHLVR